MSWDDIPSWSNDVACSLLRAVKEKDAFTFYHCLRVGRASRKLAKALGLNEFEQATLEFSGLFHDIGKVGIPDGVLLKPGRLDPQEVEMMKTHPQKSAAIVEPFSKTPFFRFLLPGIRYHHERIDGKGYPFSLEGDKIPLAARVIAIVDTVDAMSNNRPYRQALPIEKILKEIKDNSGTQFDAHIAKIYLEARPFFEKDTLFELKSEVVISHLFRAA